MTTVATLRRQVALSRAAEKAHQGDLSGAASLLEQLDAIGEASPEVLDLLARIQAQQENWVEADALWARVQDMAPANTDGADAVSAELLVAAAAGRRTVADIRDRRRASRPLLPVAVAVAAVLVVVGGVAGGVVALGGSDEPVAQSTSTQPTPGDTPGGTSSTAPTTMPGAEERAAELARRLAALEAAGRASAAARAGEVEAIARRVGGAGVVVQRQPGAVRVLFSEGVFSAGTELSPAGATALEGLGKRLTGLKATITVTGYSVVVPGGSGSGGSRTGLLRARIATQQLSAASGLPLTAFTMQSGDQAHPPYGSDAQNRTVTVTLTPVTDE
ncbi:hypothetical protein ACQPYH_09045 [Kribbella sp. CA-245084]|uniref:hypothetical protein n=1 Tax=Kribbella sp. CA-245084 TaxID=3239940 RepID=UPI003D92CA20